MQNKDPLINSVVDGYQIEDLLGHGGMGRVYRALDIKLNRYAAIKVMTQPTKKTDLYEKRFYREAQSIAKLKHPNIVAIYRFNDVEAIYYMAMEYVDGADLRWVLRDYAADDELIDYTTLLKIMEQTSSALDYAHKNGVIHRDIKPSNIMISRMGNAVLTDFGLALDVQDGTGGEVFGSPHYIAPEQAVSSANAVTQTDFYSLGVILFEMLTGSVPFDEGSAIQVAMAHIGDTLPDPLSINPDLHPAFLPVLNKILEKKPQDRYQNGAKFITALKSAIREAKKATYAPGSSTLNKPIDRIADRISPMPQPIASSLTKAATRIQMPKTDGKIKTIMPPTIHMPTEMVQENQAISKQSGNSRKPLIILGILFTFVIIAFVLFQNQTALRDSITDTFSEANDSQETNALIEGTVSAVAFGDGYITMSIYGLNVQVSREHPLYDMVQVDDSVVLEGHAIEINNALRFSRIIRARYNDVDIAIDDE